ncbi:hypothetical protein LJC04_06010 [Ruminococcaceae bacterium OttesenSCG-928-O06]|nr:hypothetical protein [Ruminococcaceae bacterium OttesenSCG-928-O06]
MATKKAGSEVMALSVGKKNPPAGAPGSSDIFVVNVKFRQNASWQGTVKWNGKSEEVHFRSTLELLKLMDQVIADNHPEEDDDPVSKKDAKKE